MDVIVLGKSYYYVYSDKLEPGKKYIINGCYHGSHSSYEPQFWTFSNSAIFVKYSGDKAVFRTIQRPIHVLYDLDMYEFYRHVSDDISDMLNKPDACGKTLKMDLIDRFINKKALP